MIRTVPNIIQHYGCSQETAQRYIDLRDEGYPAHQALLMAGLSDPPADQAPQPEAKETYFDSAIGAMHCSLEYLPNGRLTNAAYVLVRQKPLVPDESGEHPGELFISVTITREEVKDMLAWLEQDWADHVRVCGPAEGQTP